MTIYSPTSFRISDSDKAELKKIARHLGRSQADTFRFLVQEAGRMLPVLKEKIKTFPQKKAGRPRKYQTT